MYENIFYDKCFDENILFDTLIRNESFNRLNLEISLFTLEERLIEYRAKSMTIRLGDAVEAWANQFVKDSGYDLLLRHATLEDGKNADFDFAYTANCEIWFSEIKIRDDHDSTKKVSQCDDYLAKLNYLHNHYPDHVIHSCIWFVDPSLEKNKNYYLSRLSEDEVLYGEDFDGFIGIYGLYSNLVSTLEYCRKHKKEHDGNIEIDVSNYSCGKWVKFLECNKEIKDYFFPNGIPYADLLAYAKTKRNDASTRQLIGICEENLK